MPKVLLDSHPLIQPDSLERIRSHFEEDWDACRDYARQHNPVVTRTQ